MALSERAAAAAPYAQHLLYDQEVQDAFRRALGATRDAYSRARGNSARQAVKDKKLRRKVQQALGAVGELGSAIGAPARQRKPRWRRNLAALAVVGGGAFFAANPDARERVLALLGRRDAKTGNPHE